MATITSYSTKGTSLTNAEVDANFNNLNNGKIEETSPYPSIKPSLLLDFGNSQTLDPRISFTGASNRLYYDGMTKTKAEENIVTNSAANVWTRPETSNGTIFIANNAAAPDGTITAGLIQSGGTTVQSSEILLYTPPVFNLTYTFSFYVKFINHRYISAAISDRGNRWAHWTFDLQTQQMTYSTSAGSGGMSNLTGSVVSVGNDWYRCIGTGTCNTYNSMPSFIVGFAQDDNGTGIVAGGSPSWSPASTLQCLVWGAQVEQRNFVTLYTPTSGQQVTNFIPTLVNAPPGKPRFDFDPFVNECKGILLEPSKINYWPYSQDLTNSIYLKENVNVTKDVAIAPDGTKTANLVVTTSTNSTHVIARGIQLTNDRLVSFYIKSYGTLRINIYDINLDRELVINLQTGQTSSGELHNKGQIPYKLVLPVGNGWYRVILGKSAGSTYNNNIRITLSNSAGAWTYSGDNFTGVLLWGFQLEAGGFHTTYIPTAASQVTRASETFTIPVNESWYNYSEGTQYVESRSDYVIQGLIDFTSSGLGPEFYKYNQTDTWAFAYYRQTGTGLTGTLPVYVKSAGASYNGVDTGHGGSIANVPINFNDNTKFQRGASAIKPGDCAHYWYSGYGQGSTTAAGQAILPRPSTLGFATNTFLYNAFSGHIKKFAYYPKRLPNSVLQTLITP